MKLHKTLIAMLLLSTTITTLPTRAQYTLPDIGTAATTTLSIAQEKELGDLTLRQVRAELPIVNDPLLSEYINSLGSRLVGATSSSQLSYQFFLLNITEINAFAFFGGNIFVNAGLLKETSTESELASVMSHEIAHITQRHLARALEQRRASSPYTWAGVLGSVLLSIVNPGMGVMALSTTIAGTQQSIISFTQNNEQEADRIGMRILTKAAFDPQAMPTFLQKLADKSRFITKPPEMLMTHPLPNSRLTDTRNRANQFAKKNVPSSLDYYLARSRMLVFYIKKNELLLLIDEYKKGNKNQLIAAKYAEALKLSKDSKYAESAKIIDELLQQYPNNRWFIDLATDLDIEQQKTKSAVTRLQAALKLSPADKILQINLANAYIEDHNYRQAVNLLHRYTHNNPNDINGWNLLIDAYSAQKKGTEELAIRAELAALSADYDQAITLLSNASRQAGINSINQSRYDSRIDQLKQLKKRADIYKKL